MSHKQLIISLILHDGDVSHFLNFFGFWTMSTSYLFKSLIKMFLKHEVISLSSRANFLKLFR